MEASTTVKHKGQLQCRPMALAPGQPRQATLALLHRFLGLGVTFVAVVFFGLTLMGIGPLLTKDDESVATIGWAMKGATIVLTAVALLVLRPRIPKPQPGQTPAQFWATPANVQAAQLVWFILEAACILASIGFLLTGDSFLGALMIASVIIYWLNGPARFQQPA